MLSRLKKAIFLKGLFFCLINPRLTRFGGGGEVKEYMKYDPTTEDNERYQYRMRTSVELSR